jgi:hypothetical protein
MMGVGIMSSKQIGRNLKERRKNSSHQKDIQTFSNKRFRKNKY